MIRACLKLFSRLPCDPTSSHLLIAHSIEARHTAVRATEVLEIRRIETSDDPQILRTVRIGLRLWRMHTPTFPKSCKQYQEMNRIDLFRIAHFELTGKASIYHPTKPRTSYKPLSSAADWADYYFNISDTCITLEPFLQRVLRQDLASGEVEGVRKERLQMRYTLFVSSISR